MKNTKHTPGEWQYKLSTDKVQHLSEDAPYNFFSITNGAKVIGVTEFIEVPFSTTTDANKEEAEANARLIAAAPDLLEALNLTYELLSVGQPLGNDDLDKVYAAIQKATISK